MLAKCYTVAFHGMDAREVEVQCSLSAGIPAFALVGLPDKAVSESKERVRAALGAIGLSLPPKRITINLAPADLPKAGAHYDLPIALVLLAALGIAPPEDVSNCTVMGELALDGRISFVSGALPAAVAAAAAERDFICPEACGSEAALVGAVRVLAPRDLVSLINHLTGKQSLSSPEPAGPGNEGPLKDMADVKGQETARRALEVAAAGGHNMLMIGPPGAGKSMLAERLPGILPPMEPAEALDVSMIHSVAGLLEEGRVPRRRPYFDPHYGASMAAMVGGGRNAAPGQISLAHNGVLFLDELPEFARPVLESLRQPMETGEALIARAHAHVRYPARFQLIAAMNPCRCGHLADPGLACSRVPHCGLDYQGRISGPLLDRMDVQIELPGVSAKDLSRTDKGEPSAPIAARVANARALQKARLEKENVPITTNAALSGDLLERLAAPDPPGRALLDRAAERLRLTGRGYHRVMRLARTIADLACVEQIGTPHIAEAASYRRAPLSR